MRQTLSFILVLSVCLLFSGCKPKDQFALTMKDVDPAGSTSVGGDYAWSWASLGSTLDGHGLPSHIMTFVIIHKSTNGKYDLVWPNFVYGDDQANAAVLGDTVVFTACLPNGKPVLLANQPGQPPVVISEGVLKLAAQRLGSSVIVPEQDYMFTKVRLPPDRIWLQGQPLSKQYFPAEQTFSVELTTDDLAKVIAETRQKAKPFKAGRFDYLAEDGAPCVITAADVQALGIPAVGANGPAEPAIHKTTGYTPQNERLSDGQVLLDVTNNYAYFSTVHEPARILKVALGDDPATSPMVVGEVTFEADENDTFNAVLDPRGGYAYFGTKYPAHVVKVALGDSNQPPYRVGSVLIDKDENIGVGVMDESDLYFNVEDKFYELSSGIGNAAPAIVTNINLPDRQMDDGSAVVDPINHHAYVGSDEVTIEKFALGSSSAPRLLGQIKPASQTGGFRGAVIDPQAGYAWFTGDDGYVVKIALGHGDELPKLISTTSLGSKFYYLQYTFGKDDDGYAYYGTMDGGSGDDGVERIAAIIKVALGKNDEPPKVASYLELPRGYNITSGVVDPVRHTLIAGMNFATDNPGDACCKIVKFNLGKGTAAPTMASEVKLAK